MKDTDLSGRKRTRSNYNKRTTAEHRVTSSSSYKYIDFEEYIRNNHPNNYSLYRAAHYGLIAKLKLLLENQKEELNKNISIDELLEDSDGYTLLHAAIEGGQPEIIIWLIENGAMLIDDPKTSRALNIAAREGYIECIEIILRSFDVDVNLEDDMGHNALYIAITSTNNPELIHYLLAHGAHPPLELSEEDLNLILNKALEMDLLEVVEELRAIYNIELNNEELRDNDLIQRESDTSNESNAIDNNNSSVEASTLTLHILRNYNIPNGSSTTTSSSDNEEMLLMESLGHIEINHYDGSI